MGPHTHGPRSHPGYATGLLVSSSCLGALLSPSGLRNAPVASSSLCFAEDEAHDFRSTTTRIQSFVAERVWSRELTDPLPRRLTLPTNQHESSCSESVRGISSLEPPSPPGPPSTGSKRIPPTHSKQKTYKQLDRPLLEDLRLGLQYSNEDGHPLSINSSTARARCPGLSG